MKKKDIYTLKNSVTKEFAPEVKEIGPLICIQLFNLKMSSFYWKKKRKEKI